MSFSRGTLVSVSGSAVSNDAQRIGSAAFFAPDTVTSPFSGSPPSMTSLSMRWLGPVLFGRQRLHRKRVNFRAHPVAERRVHEAVSRKTRQPAERIRHDQRLEMLTVTRDLHV